MARGFKVLVAAITMASVVGAVVLSDPLYARNGEIDISGKVLAFDGITPVPGVIVSLVGEGKGQEYRGKPSDVQGRYRISSVTDGEYTITVETDRGTFQLPTVVVISGGQPSAITVILPEDASRTLEAGPLPGDGRAAVGRWIAIGSAGAVLLVVLLHNLDEDDEEEDEDISPSAP